MGIKTYVGLIIIHTLPTYTDAQWSISIFKMHEKKIQFEDGNSLIDQTSISDSLGEKIK